MLVDDPIRAWFWRSSATGKRTRPPVQPGDLGYQTPKSHHPGIPLGVGGGLLPPHSVTTSSRSTPLSRRRLPQVSDRPRSRGQH